MPPYLMLFLILM